MNKNTLNLYQSICDHAHVKLAKCRCKKGLSNVFFLIYLQVIGELYKIFGQRIFDNNLMNLVPYILNFCDNEFDFWEIVSKITLGAESQFTQSNIDLAIKDLRKERANLSFFQHIDSSCNHTVASVVYVHLNSWSIFEIIQVSRNGIICINEANNIYGISKLYSTNLP